MKNRHTDFILSPISKILENAVASCIGIGSGIETYPLCDYLMQSTFLKMTGFQEQKMKCICWELATHDYNYRRILLANDDKLGECSSYHDKSNIYKRLISNIETNSTFNIETDIDKAKISRDVKSSIKNIFIDTNLSLWTQREFNEFTCTSIIPATNFATRKNLLESSWQDKYKALYNHRNRCAHNTLSYQQNLPTLKTLESEDYKYENYFLWFALLVLIDEVFMELYRRYLNTLE